jgi:hypothetical protein
MHNPIKILIKDRLNGHLQLCCIVALIIVCFILVSQHACEHERYFYTLEDIFKFVTWIWNLVILLN